MKSRIGFLKVQFNKTASIDHFYKTEIDGVFIFLTTLM